MSWLNSQLKSSLLALLGSDVFMPSLREDRIQEIRKWMLDELEKSGEPDFSALVHRVRYAIDAQALWYARSDVMTVLANRHGETVAHEKIDYISQKFKDLLPRAFSL